MSHRVSILIQKTAHSSCPVLRVPLIVQALELIVEKVIASGGQPMSPGDGMRRVFEALSSGLLLPGSPGLLDPCEKDPLDAATHLTAQEREEITASAQVRLSY